VARGRKQQDRGNGEVPWLAEGEPGKVGESEGGTLGARWRPRTRQQDGRVTEKKVAKDLGARLHPNSGALRIKHDASDRETLYEIKDANKTYTLKAEELNELWTRAARELKAPEFVVVFKHHGITATMTVTKEIS